MTRVLSGLDLGERIQQKFPDAIVDAGPDWAEVKTESLLDVCTFLRDDPELDFGYLNSLTAVDRLDHFEVVYHLQSIGQNQASILKTRCHDHDNPEIPSVVSVWRGAQLQERETFDLMGILFQGHPDLRRVFLWEGFPGHPLRKDWLNLPGGQMAGLERFPGEPGGKLEGRG